MGAVSNAFNSEGVFGGGARFTDVVENKLLGGDAANAAERAARDQAAAGEEALSVQERVTEQICGCGL